MSISKVFSPSIEPLQQHLDHTLPVPNIANRITGFPVHHYPSCGESQCNAWPEGGPRPTGPYSVKPKFKNPKKKTKEEKRKWEDWKKNREIALLSE